MEDIVEMIESAITEIPDISCALELDLLEVGEKKMLTLYKNNTVYLGLVGLGSENEELTTSEKAVVCSDAKDSATGMQEDKRELLCNSFVGNNNNGALPVPDYQNPEYSGNQIPVASTSHAVQKAFVNRCSFYMFQKPMESYYALLFKSPLNQAFIEFFCWMCSCSSTCKLATYLRRYSTLNCLIHQLHCSIEAMSLTDCSLSARWHWIKFSARQIAKPLTGFRASPMGESLSKKILCGIIMVPISSKDLFWTS
ncbi:hypothetical protein POM88_007989 [Heracleum sosnowskyi]|uniref:Uncharacterized protein n=1 Tax=Heracleum sosnowskyi TaxID=360622 RepID=A0AAD8J8K0_9APIA|nr:hypothetical protein POM88_007989 [Heracleum sosnowskyi]